MPTEAEYRNQIAPYNQKHLLELWQQILSGETPDWEPGKAIEYLVIRAFEIEGADVTYPYTVRISGTIVEQIDGAVYTDGLACLVECKDREGNIAIDPVAKLRNQLLRRPAGAVGIVCSTTGFTEATIILAQYNANQAILLWEQDDLDYALQHQSMRQGLVKKYRYCIERGLPNYNLIDGDLS
ncbi:MAG: restriction endonuclease [Rhizonema sp. PD37]|nr:restriction endonuclease [Rhizonema sp. PD37]